MKLAMVDPSLFTGRYDDSLCSALGQAGHEVILLGRPKRATDAIEHAHYRYDPHFFGLSERVRGVAGEGRLFRAIKGTEYLAAARLGGLGALKTADVVHVQWLPLPMADRHMLVRLKGQKHRPALVHTVHNASAFHGDSGAQGRGYGALLREFDALIVHGAETRAALVAQGVAEDRIHIVSHPPMELALASEQDMKAVRQPRRPRILFFGTIRPYKGFDLLIDAALALWREGRDCELAVAGKPFMDIDALIGKVRGSGFCDRLLLDLGFLQEGRLDAHLRKADIIAFPYRDIDSSGAFLSALHYGKAMVATRVGMFAGMDEKAIALCPPDNSGALANIMRLLVKDAGERARLGREALALRAGLGQWNDAAAATLAVYETALERVQASL
ncbi:MAG: glycosyltransferase family 4 protein [Sphingobium sp.]|nr:glycosyltransferase family 4 protein [Sphingobium sp.]MCP5400262.1 glycosyltransferase family 4 protein [Sphingomonas sp.]